MKTNKLLGILIILAIFATIFVLGVEQYGLKTTIVAFAGSFGTTALILFAVWLIFKDEEK